MQRKLLLRLLAVLCLFAPKDAFARRPSAPERIASRYEWLEPRYPDVRIVIDRPERMRKNRPTKVLFYALPNGNTIEWTAGKKMEAGDDWHYDIQHIAAQTRFLRKKMKRCNIVTVYLMAEGKSWTAWRTLHAQDKAQVLPAIVDEVLDMFSAYRPKAVLSGHSGGGYFLFEYIRAVERIPDSVERLAFLDSTYGYQDSLHAEKLTEWIARRKDHRLCVISYQDATVVIDGKHIVSASGGTWGRSFAMAADLARCFSLRSSQTDDFIDINHAQGRIFFKLKKNPDGHIYHTVLVERNGFIDTVLEGTSKAGRGYRFWGERAYSRYLDQSPIVLP